MHCPTLAELPPPPKDKTGWPWTEESPQLSEMSATGHRWPKVSIVTPSYNQGQFIEASIRSVLLQGYPDLEYIIIDGGSTDESVDMIRKYERWVSYWVSESDRGQSHAINKGLEKCTGQLFNWHNADDVLTPGSLAKTAEALETHPDASYAHGYRIIIDRESNIVYDTKRARGDEMRYTPAIHEAVSSLSGAMQPGCLMRRNLVIDQGGIDETLHYIMDKDLLLRLALKQPPLYIPVPVILLREHLDAKTFAWTTEQAKERFIIADKIFAQQDLPEDIRVLKRSAYAAAHRFAWRCYGKAGKKMAAFKHLIMDLYYAPFDDWMQRRRIVKDLAVHHSNKWLYLTYRMMKKVEVFFSRLGHTVKNQ